MSLMLALPDPCLLAVLQCLAAANDHCSLFSAARAHSRLHQAAAVALTSVAVWAIRQQEVLDGVLLYLSRHAQHVSNLSLDVKYGYTVALRQLPPNLRLGSLKLHGFDLQLQPGDGWQGALGPAAELSALRQLELVGCTLLDGNEGLAAALALLPPGLEDLSFGDVRLNDFQRSRVTFPTSILQQGLQQLTHLEFGGVELQGADQSSPALQPLQVLSRLADLRLYNDNEGGVLTASMLSGAAGLTRLELYHFEPGVLVGKMQLQHLKLIRWEAPQDAAWTAQLLAQLESLQQLTYLEYFRLTQATSPPAAYSALTASSKLQLVRISSCALPAGAWGHVFPAGRRLPHLTSLTVWGVEPRDGPYMAAPDGSRLVSCCPGLRCLDVSDLTYSAGAFGPLSALSGLHTLTVRLHDTGEAFSEVRQLRHLSVRAPSWVAACDYGLLLQTTQLRRLTTLDYSGPLNGRVISAKFTHGPGDEPVWRRVLRRHLKHSDPAVAQAAAAALAESE